MGLGEESGLDLVGVRGGVEAPLCFSASAARRASSGVEPMGGGSVKSSSSSLFAPSFGAEFDFLVLCNGHHVSKLY